MTDAKAGIGEAIWAKAFSSKEVSRGGVVGSEEPKERGGGTGSGCTNGLVRVCRIQNTRHSCDPDSGANDRFDLVQFSSIHYEGGFGNGKSKKEKAPLGAISGCCKIPALLVNAGTGGLRVGFC